MEIVWSRAGKRPFQRGKTATCLRKLPSACRPQGKTRGQQVGAWVRTGLGGKEWELGGGCPAESNRSPPPEPPS